MAIVWGGWAGSTTYRRERVGVDISVSGTKVTVAYYYQTDGAVSDGQTLVRSGAITGSQNFTAKQTGTNGGSGLIATNSFTGSRGSSYTIGAKITGVWTGAVPSVSTTVTVPALRPAKPNAPSITNLTSSSCSVIGSAPANNGSAINLYEFQRSSNSTFTSGLASMTTTSASGGAFGGMTGNTDYWGRYRVRNGVGWSDWSNGTKLHTKPVAPSAPTNPSSNRVSDTSITSKWTRTASTAAPWDQVIPIRWDNVTDKWTNLNPLAGTATSFTDTSVRADRQYRYRFQAKNSAGTSNATTAAIINTTPGAPTSLKAVKVGDSIRTTFTPGASYPVTHEVWHQAGTSTPVLLQTLAAGTNEYTHTNPSNLVTHTYQIRAKAPSPVLYSTSVTSNTVQLAAPPNPPTIELTAVGDITTTQITTTWEPNPVDSSEQRQYQVRTRQQGTSTWATEPIQTGENTTYTWAPAIWANGQTAEIEVRTWGVHTTPSPWSATATARFSATPAVTITAPATIYHAPTLTVEWEYYQAENLPQAQWYVELINENGSTVQTRQGTGPTTLAAFAFVMPDATAWTIRVVARSGAGIWSLPVEQGFTVDYPAPQVPSISLEYLSDSGAVEIGVENPEAVDQQPEAAYNQILRAINDGPWIEVATEIATNGTVIDPTPQIAGVNRYKAIAWSSLPSTAESEVVEVTVSEPGWIYVNYGPAFANFVRVYGSPSLGGGISRPKTKRKYAGRKRATAFLGEGAERDIKVSAVLTPEAPSLFEWEQAVEEATDICYRDPKGRRIFGTFDGFSHQWQRARGICQISFTVDESDYRE
ncbi:fibronectin type III domain-containing protein [Jonesiaceae bacterium BS-20]|uniref:Fibronectin type III domain-containing protein n=1 Tax=Jonesiaceae bacterium BS-20 TaxID=3120821 RepID=A0AAU7DY09_9MICO